MIEYGSDFHYIENGRQSANNIFSIYPSANYYADGRQPLIHLCKTMGWERLWLPEYFCYDVVESLKNEGVNLRFYSDWPDYHDDSKTLDAIRQRGYFKPRDAVLRVNYYGLRSFRDSRSLPVAAIIEDHTHDLLGGWARHSTADWCIASLRKSLPIPEGGMLWSPKGLRLPEAPGLSEKNESIASIRWKSMKLKADYLAGQQVEKTLFRSGFLETEAFFDRAPVCSLDKESYVYLQDFDIVEWYTRKLNNWKMLSCLKKNEARIIWPENEGCYPFSLVLCFDFGVDRDRVRKAMIEQNIYPAILWSIPYYLEEEVFKFSRNMLSIHCDGRYTADDILQMERIIESII